MPFALLFVGILLIIAGVRNTQDTLFSLVKGDFSGDANFFYWFVSIMIIGTIGYIPKLKPFSNAFLILVILVLFLKRGDPKSNSSGGFFEQFSAALGATKVTTPTQTTASNTEAYPIPTDLQDQLRDNLNATSQQLNQELSNL